MCQILDDPTGNSFVENPFAPVKDDALDVLHYVRTRQQNIDIGCVVRPIINDLVILLNCGSFILLPYIFTPRATFLT